MKMKSEKVVMKADVDIDKVIEEGVAKFKQLQE